ncbi:MAG TPA: hypothetical protein VGK97_07195 [Spongiibacteraceae bacterium]|jgi:hypothetical protein
MKKNALRITVLAAALMACLTAGCGGGGSSNHSSSSGNNSGTVEGVTTPSNLSVVTAQNADAGS